MGIGAKLDNLLKEIGSNANELAQKIGVPPQTIYSMIKRDSKKADIEVLIKISQALGVKPEYFCDDSITIPASSAYDEVITVYTRSKKNLSQEEKMRLARIILSDDKE